MANLDLFQFTSPFLGRPMIPFVSHIALTEEVSRNMWTSDQDDDDSSDSSGPDFGTNKLTNKPFQSPFPWHGDGFSGHRIDSHLLNSSEITRRLHAPGLSIPAFPNLGPMGLRVEMSPLNALPAKKKSKTNNTVASQKLPVVAVPKKKAAAKKREKKPLPQCLKEVKLSDRDEFLHEGEDTDDDKVVEVCCAFVCGGDTACLKDLNLCELRRVCAFFDIEGNGQFSRAACKHKLLACSLHNACDDRRNDSERSLLLSCVEWLSEVTHAIGNRILSTNGTKTSRGCMRTMSFLWPLNVQIRKPINCPCSSPCNPAKGRHTHVSRHDPPAKHLVVQNARSWGVV